MSAETGFIILSKAEKLFCDTMPESQHISLCDHVMPKKLCNWLFQWIHNCSHLHHPHNIKISHYLAIQNLQQVSAVLTRQLP